MVSQAERSCRPLVTDAGFADRTPLVLARERGLWDLHAAQVLRARSAPAGDMLSATGPTVSGPVITTGAPAGGTAPITVARLDAVLAAADPVDAVGAAFIAGRCVTDDPADLDGFRDHLRTIAGRYDASNPDETSLLVTECAMSLALLGEAEASRELLRTMVSAENRRSTTDAIAAYYLVQLGDVCGYPLITWLLGHELGHYRVLGARQLSGFLPHDGEQVDGEVIDVVGRLSDLLDDKDADVGVVIPGLLAEIGGDSVVPILERAARKAKRRQTRKAAAWALDRLRGHEAPA